MRKTRQLSILAALSVAGVLAACGRATDTSQSDDFGNDLKLASASTMDLATPKVDPSLLNSALENRAEAAPRTAAVVKRAPGPRVLQSKTPTRRAAPTGEVATAGETSDQSTSVESAPAADASEPVAIAPRPTPGAQPGAGSAPGDYGTSGNGGGIFGPSGGLGGVVIFGGGADGDHCEPRGGRRGGMGRSGGMGGVGRPGGMGGIGGIFGPVIIRSAGAVPTRPLGGYAGRTGAMGVRGRIR